MSIADRLAGSRNCATAARSAWGVRARARRGCSAAATTLVRTMHPGAGMAAVNNLRRSTSDSWIGGVCGGIAASPASRAGSGA